MSRDPKEAPVVPTSSSTEIPHYSDTSLFLQSENISVGVPINPDDVTDLVATYYLPEDSRVPCQCLKVHGCCNSSHGLGVLCRDKDGRVGMIGSTCIGKLPVEHQLRRMDRQNRRIQKIQKLERLVREKMSGVSDLVARYNEIYFSFMEAEQLPGELRSELPLPIRSRVLSMSKTRKLEVDIQALYVMKGDDGKDKILELPFKVGELKGLDLFNPKQRSADALLSDSMYFETVDLSRIKHDEAQLNRLLDRLNKFEGDVLYAERTIAASRQFLSPANLALLCLLTSSLSVRKKVADKIAKLITTHHGDERTGKDVLNSVTEYVKGLIGDRDFRCE